MAAEILNRSLDCGVLTFQPPDKGLQSISLGRDELVLLTHPQHPLAARRRVSLEEVGRQTVIAHNDPSPARERVLRLYERRHAPINIQIALPSLDGIKRAVEIRARRRGAAAPLRAGGNLARPAGGRQRARARVTAAGPAGLPPQRRAVARRRGVSGNGEG